MTGRFELRLPDLGEGIVEGTIGVWFVEPGAEVVEDQPLVEVETDKASVEIPSPVSGRLLEAVAVTGSVVPVGSVLAVLDAESGSEPPPERERSLSPALLVDPPAAPAAVPPPAQPVGDVEVAATPGARRLASRLGIDLDTAAIPAEGGLIREEHVRSYAAVGQPASDSTAGLPDRSVIVSRLTRAAAVPTVTNVDEADFSAVQAAGASPLTVLAFVVSRALLDHPLCNMLAPDGRAVPQDSVHLGIATQTAGGLVVPVVRHAESLGVVELGSAIGDVSGRARSGRLRPDELTGSTFTITSAGRMAGQWSTPLLNLPEVAILGLYRIADRPVVRKGAVVVRPVGNLTITFDHRYLDGMIAAAFLQAVIGRLEAWTAQP